MKSTKMFTILVMALGLMVLPASVASAAQSLTINGQDVTSITLELGQSCTVEVVSSDSTSYVDYVGFDNGVVLGDFSHLETKAEAGDLAAVVEYDQPAFYGYNVNANGISPAPSPGVHFVFEYVGLQVGETDVKLYDSTLTSVIDSIHITVIRPKMGTAFSYQGRLMDDNEVADGLYDFEFKLYDYKSGGSQLGSTIDINDLDVIDGQFAVKLDFGSGIFDGNAVWLETTVAHGDGNDPCTLTPRTELTPTPYALQTRGLFVDNAGNVGIGTTSPGRKLDVAGNINATDYYFLNDNVLVHSIKGSGTFHYGWDVNVKRHHMSTDGVERLVIDHLGNVGIGTTSPAHKLEVRDTQAIARLTSDGSVGSRLELHNINEDPDTLGFINFSHYFSGVRGQIAYSWDGMDFKTANTQRMRIDKNGNVGIGTTSPFAKLDVTTSEPNGQAVYGEASNSGDVTNYGGYFKAAGNTGRGVCGAATGAWGTGVYGMALNNRDVTNYGGYFVAAGGNGSGVYGEASYSGDVTNYGGYFKAAGDWGRGVEGAATGTSGMGVKGTAWNTGDDVQNYGGYFTTQGGKGRGVYGAAHRLGDVVNYGGYFQAAGEEGRGVYGEAFSSLGNRTNYGGYFKAAGKYGFGVYAEATGTYGIGVIGKGKYINFSATGGIYNYVGSSSIRWKTNIRPIDNPLDKILQLRGVYFDWDAEHGGHHDVGMIAEEVGEVMPEIVVYEENGIDANGMEYGMLTPLLVEVVKALKVENDSLKVRVEALERTMLQLAKAKELEL